MLKLLWTSKPDCRYRAEVAAPDSRENARLAGPQPKRRRSTGLKPTIAASRHQDTVAIGTGRRAFEEIDHFL